MKVVHVFKDYYPPTTGGIEQHMQVLCAGLARHIDVTVLVPSRSRRRSEERLDGVRVIRVPEFGRYFSAPLCPSMPAELRRLSPDLVHLHFPNPTGDLAYLLSGCRAPVVMTYHADVVRRSFLLRPYRPVFGLLVPHIRRFIATSREYLDSAAFLAPYRERCTVVPPSALTWTASPSASARSIRSRSSAAVTASGSSCSWVSFATTRVWTCSSVQWRA